MLTITHLANLRVAQGRIDEAADLLAPFEDRVTTCGPLARVHLGQGEPDLAAAVLRRGLQELLGDVLRAGPLLGLLVEVELRRGSLDAAREAADELSALVASIDAEVLRADAALAEGRVRVAEGDVPGAIDSFGAAKSYLAGNQRPLQLGLVCLELAEVMRTASDEPAAIAEARAALACFERLGATSARDRTSALLRTMGDTARTRTPDVGELADGLTRREKEVLDLVREGLANAEIAERLFISPKTAEHHVGRILTKLGVRNRAEAAALAVRMASLTEK